MDPFSITAGVAGLLSLTIQLQLVLSNYTSSVKHAVAESRELATELTALASVLEQLERFIERQSHRGDSFVESSVLYTTMNSCHARLKSLQTTLDGFLGSTKSKAKMWQRSIKWPLAKEGHQQTILALQNCVNIFHFSLSIDGWQMVAESMKDFSSIRAHQGSQFFDISQMLAATEDANYKLGSCQSKLDDIQHLQSYMDRRETLDWICSVDPSVSLNNAQKRREPGTGTWFLESQVFLDWCHSAGLLWLAGIPGCGKTVLCSTVIEAVKLICTHSSDDTMAYFFFGFQDAQTQNTEIMLRSIVRQLCASEREIPQTVQELFLKFRDSGQSPTLTELSATLTSMVRASSKKTYIIIDALDEVPEKGGASHRKELLHVLADIVSKKFSNLHILCTSRDEVDIRAAINHLSQATIHLGTAEVDADIRMFIRRSLIDPTERFVKLSTALRIDIEDVVGNGARGMFRWAACQLDTLKECRKARDIKVALKTLPQSLDETYSRILSKIEEKDVSDAMAIMQWLAFSKRPLTLAEIAEAAVVRPQVDSFDADDRLIHITEVLRICQSLIALDMSTTGVLSEASMHVRFAHYSVQEYLLSERSGRFSLPADQAHAYIASSCVSYLLTIEKMKVDRDKGTKYYQWFPLFPYSARYWYEHAASVVETPELLNLMFNLFHPGFDRRTYRWVQFYEPLSRKYHRNDIIIFPGPLFYSTFLGFKALTERLLDAGMPINQIHRFEYRKKNTSYHPSGNEWTDGCTVLEIAVYNGNVDITEMLLSRGADCNAHSEHGSILQRALARADVNEAAVTRRITLMLLEHGADIRATHSDGSVSPLTSAAEYGFLEIVQALIEQGADPDLFEEALRVAVECGHEDIVCFLLNVGAGTNATGLIQAATERGNQRILEVLLRIQTEDTIRAQLCRSLRIAATRGHEQILRNLLAFWELHLPKTQVEALLDFSLLVTYLRSHFKDKRWILQRGEGIAAQWVMDEIELTRYGYWLMFPWFFNCCENSNIPLRMNKRCRHEPGRGPHTIIVPLAILQEANVNALAVERLHPVHPFTLLQHAVKSGDQDATATLMIDGVGDDIKDEDYDNLIQVACRMGHIVIVQLLFMRSQTRVSLNYFLMEALRCGHRKVAKFLLKAGADMNEMGVFNPGFGPLIAPHSSVLQYPVVFYLHKTRKRELLFRLSAHADRGQPPTIESAACGNQRSTFKLLFQRDVTMRPLAIHCIGWQTTFRALQTLIQAGVNINTMSQDSETALEVAKKEVNDRKLE